MSSPFTAHCATALLRVRHAAKAFALAWIALTPALAWAQVDAKGIALRLSPSLQNVVATDAQQKHPTFVFGDQISGRTGLETRISGRAELRRLGVVMRSDEMEYDPTTELVKARGNVYINRHGDVYQGSQGQMRMDTQEGYFLDARYRSLRGDARGQAARIDFIDEQRSIAHDANYSVWHSEPGSPDSSDWIIRGEQIQIDQEANVGVARGGRLEFFGVPILGAPYLSFPLSNERKSGWLVPRINLDTVSGLDLLAPYYFNLAPNRDATLYPNLLSRRGVNLGTEFRYLERDYQGSLRVDWMPSDRLRDSARWRVLGSHHATVQTGITGFDQLSLSAALHRVGDDDYWRDFPRALGSSPQRLLANDLSLQWRQGDWALATRALKWQTLQQPGSIITPPYDRMPQINARLNQAKGPVGLEYSAELDTTRFVSTASMTNQPNAQRSYALLQLSRPVRNVGTFLIPKVQLHSTAYAFDAISPTYPNTWQRSFTRVVPTFSLDSGAVFERDITFFNRPFLQTLEPRVFYVYTPYKQQSSIPIYDSGATDFNYSAIFTENAFTGHDRISDSQVLTGGLSSSLIDPKSGAEVVRLSYGQRLRLKDQRVTLPSGAIESAGFSDMLFGASVNWQAPWSTAATLQYSPKTRQSSRAVMTARYAPSDYRVINASYRFNRGTSEQIDMSWQWPLGDLWGDRGKVMERGLGQGRGRWYSVGRLNFSLRDRKQVDTVLGLEYDGGSWLARAVYERLQTTTSSATARILLQLEFVGFARVGSSPLSSLRSQISGYHELREKMRNPIHPLSYYD